MDDPGSKPKPALDLKFISHGTLESKDLARSRAFYEEFLGFEVVRASDRTLWVRLGGNHIYVVIRATPAHVAMPFTNHNGIDVHSDAEVDRAHQIVLRDAETWGLTRISNPRVQHGTYSFYFWDADENAWEILSNPAGGYNWMFERGDQEGRGHWSKDFERPVGAPAADDSDRADPSPQRRSFAVSQAAPSPIEATGPKAGTGGARAAFAAMVGLTWGPSTIAIMGLGVFIRPLQAEFGWSRAQVALVATVINLTIMLVSPIQGVLVDRFGARRVVLPSVLVFAAGLALLYCLPRNLAMFYLAWSLVVAASVGLLPGSFLHVVGAWFDRRLGLAMGLANSGIGLGNILVPLVASAVIAAYGWRLAYVSLGLIVLCVVLPVCLAWLREPAGPAEMAEEKQTRLQARAAGFSAAVRSRAFAVMACAFFLLGLVNTALVSQQVPLLIDSGVSPQKAALVQSLFGLFLLVGRLGAGVLLDRVFAPVLMIVTALGAAAACLIYSTGTSSDLVFLAAALIGLVVGTEFDVLGYIIKRYFGMAAFGKLYGVTFAVFQLGGALGAAAFAFSHSLSGSYRYGLYGAAAVLLMACLAVLQLPKYSMNRTILAKIE